MLIYWLLLEVESWAFNTMKWASYSIWHLVLWPLWYDNIVGKSYIAYLNSWSAAYIFVGNFTYCQLILRWNLTNILVKLLVHLLNESLCDVIVRDALNSFENLQLKLLELGRSSSWHGIKVFITKWSRFWSLAFPFS